MTRFNYPTAQCREATDDTGFCVAHDEVHRFPRLTRDLCQDDWQAVHPDEYFPNVTRYGTCAECGEESTLVARSRIADERETPIARMLREERSGLGGYHVNHTTGKENR